MYVKEKSLCTVQPHVIDKNVTLVSEKLVDEIKGISQSDLQELLHWRTVTNILMVLSPDRVLLFREIEGIGFDGSNNEVQGCDSHFHPEMLLKKYRVSNLKQVDSKVGEPLTMGCLIGNLCFPNKWVCHSEIQDSRLWWAFGFHPRLVTSFESEHYYILDKLLKGNRVVGLGEVGLDYTHAENTWGAQRLVLKTLLPLVVIHDKAVVIHCRENAAGHGKAGRDCRLILSKVLPSYHRIHVHCFQGDVGEALEWVRLFPNVRFGLAPKCLGNRTTRALVTTLQMSRFVLESDSPYLCVQDGGESHPGLVLAVAVEVSKLLGRSYQWVLQSTFKYCSVV